MSLTILGVDPSLTRTGLALVKMGKRPKLLDVSKIGTKPSEPMAHRLGKLAESVREFAVRHAVKHAAVELTMSFNAARSSLSLAQARGACLVGLHQAGVAQIDDVNPAVVKKAVAGKGNATKPEVEAAVRKAITGFKAFGSLTHDEWDAVAVALAHCGKVAAT